MNDMITIEKKKIINIRDNVYFLGNPEENFNKENLYLSVREKEKRIYDDSTLISLPEVDIYHPHYYEWQIRKKSARKLLKYILQNKKNIDILDLGCGGGWLSNFISSWSGNDVYAVDLNIKELEQGAKVFCHNDKLFFIYGDIVDDIFFPKSFDIIIIASAIQYFDNLNILLNRLFYFLKPGGEIHIIDSPIYNESEIVAARNRTENYYRDIESPEMKNYYFHHSWNELNGIKYLVMNQAALNFHKFKKYFTVNKIKPFPWIKITH